MTNGIIVNGIVYRAVNCLSTGLVVDDPCKKCDLKKVCEKTECQYPCDIFKKKDHLCHFKKLK